MKRILLLGATGHLGKVLTDCLIKHNYYVVALVRNPQKVSNKYNELKIIKGDLTNKNDIEQALKTIDIVISTLGHGFRTSYPIQEKTMKVLIPLMEEKHITRFITITGAALSIKGDPTSFISRMSELVLSLIDPYRMKDAKQQQILLEKSNLEWTVVRTPIHNNSLNQKITHIGFTQPKPWYTLSRNAIAEFMIDCIEQRGYIKKSPIIY